MTKKDIVKKLANKVNCTLNDANLFYTNMLEVMEEALLESGELQLTFGKFRLKRTKDRPGYSVVQRKMITVPGRNYVSFKPNIRIKDVLLKDPRHFPNK